MNLMSKNKVTAAPIAMIPAWVAARPLTSTVMVYRGDHVLSGWCCFTSRLVTGDGQHLVKGPTMSSMPGKIK